MRQPGSRRAPRPAVPAAALAASLAALLLGGCQEEVPEPPEVVRPVKILEVQGGGAKVVREYPGRIRALQQADMAFEVAGRIVEFRFKEGERVREGEVLARLDERDFQAQFDSAKAQYENARVNLDRAQKLHEEGALSAVERDRRKTVFDTADARLREATKALEDTSLRAPFAGVMSRKLVEDYENVQAKQPVLVLQDDSHLEIRVDVPERDMAGPRRDDNSPEAITKRIRPRVVVTSIPNREFPARVEQLATIADPETRTFEATFVFDTPTDVNVLPGMTAKVVIDAPAEMAARAGMRIPAAAAVSDSEGSPYVWVVDPESMRVRRRPVELGELFGSEVGVRSGLQDGELIAISGVHQLRDGVQVRRFEP